MDKLYEYIKDTVVNFKLDRCCCVAPIRLGLLITGYFNIFYALLSLVGTADDGFTPPLMAVQALITEDDVSKPLGIAAYAAELAFNMILLCGMYRNDPVLLRVYMYFVFVSIVSSLLVYSLVFAGISLLIKMLILWMLVFQVYIIILVRSAIVEIKETRTSEKNGHVTLYSVVRMPDGPAPKPDVEAGPVTDPKDRPMEETSERNLDESAKVDTVKVETNNLETNKVETKKTNEVETIKLETNKDVTKKVEKAKLGTKKIEKNKVENINENLKDK